MADTDDTATRLAAIKERAAKATAGPWSAIDGGQIVSGSGRWLLTDSFETDGAFNYAEDADFSANARDDVPWLLAYVEQLQRERDELRKAVERGAASFKKLFPNGYAPKVHQKHSANHPKTIRSVLDDPAVPDAAKDVIAGVLFFAAIDRDRSNWVCEETQETMRECDKLRRENAALAKFKAYVHQRLDDAGIPVDPESTHKAQGCRIGGRLDIVLSRATEAAAVDTTPTTAATAAEGKGHGKQTEVIRIR